MSAKDKAEKVQAQRDAERARAIDAALIAVMGDVQGRAFMWWIVNDLAEADTSTLTRVNGAPEVSMWLTAQRDGMQSVARSILKRVRDLTFAHYVAMISENAGPPLKTFRQDEEEDDE